MVANSPLVPVQQFAGPYNDDAVNMASIRSCGIASYVPDSSASLQDSHAVSAKDSLLLLRVMLHHSRLA